MPDLLVTAREFVDAFNARDLDRFVAVLHPEVQIHAGRGLRNGRDQARDWATRSAEGVQQRIVIETMREGQDWVLATILREWWWQDAEEEDEFAHREEMAWLFRFEDGLIREWQPFDDRSEAQRGVA